MYKQPKISVIVPVYNAEKYLKKCLDSLRFQTYHNLEIICVDDGSSDKSLEILNEYALNDNRISVLEANHAGVAAARNIGLEKASGDYISFIDSDDWVLLTLYEVFVDYLNKTDSLDIYMFNIGSYPVGCNDVLQMTVFDLSEWRNHTDKYAIHCFKDCIIPFTKNVSVCNKIFNHEFLKKINVKFPEGLIYEDQYFYINTFLKASTIMINPDIFYRYRNVESGSILTTRSNKVFDMFKISDLVENEIKLSGEWEHYKYAFFQYKFINYTNVYMKTPLEIRENYFNEMKQRLLAAEVGLDKRIYSQLRNYHIFELIKTSNYNFFNVELYSICNKM